MPVRACCWPMAPCVSAPAIASAWSGAMVRARPPSRECSPARRCLRRAPSPAAARWAICPRIRAPETSTYVPEIASWAPAAWLTLPAACTSRPSAWPATAMPSVNEPCVPTTRRPASSKAAAGMRPMQRPPVSRRASVSPSACWGNRSARCQAASVAGSNLPAFSSAATTYCCSTSPPTTWTPTPSAGCDVSWRPIRAASW